MRPRLRLAFALAVGLLSFVAAPHAARAGVPRVLVGEDFGATW